MSESKKIPTAEEYRQDILQALNSDLEQGSHWMNEAASVKFNREFPKLLEQLQRDDLELVNE